MAEILTRTGLRSLVDTNLPSGTGAISAEDHRDVEDSLIDSFATIFEAEIRVVNMTTTTPPGGASDRDAYVVASGATGAWAGQDGEIAVWDDDKTGGGGWQFSGTPKDGQAVWNLADDTQYRWDAGISPAAWAAQAGSVDKATGADIRAGTLNKYITADGVESAAELVTLTDGANIALDWSTFLAAEVTLAGNRTLDNPSNGEPGTWRTIIVKQDGTGSRTLAFGNQYLFPGGSAPTLTTDASAEDVLSILCVTASKFFVFSALDLS